LTLKGYPDLKTYLPFSKALATETVLNSYKDEFGNEEVSDMLVFKDHLWTTGRFSFTISIWDLKV
jgi:hypothetical protein